MIPPIAAAFSGRGRLALVALALAGSLVACQSEKSGTEGGPPGKSVVSTSPDSDPQAVAIADRVMKAMGGRKAWDQTRYITWNFFGARRTYWDKWTDDVRVEDEDVTILMNLDTRVGRVRKAGKEIVDPDAVASYMRQGFAWWTNDSYWMFMPYKLRDPGVTLKYLREETLKDGRFGDVLGLTFEHGVGLTPRNRYEVFVNRETNLVEQWSYFVDRDDPKPRFTQPWSGWKQFGGILLATNHGQGKNWEIAVYDQLPETVFQNFEDVIL